MVTIGALELSEITLNPKELHLLRRVYHGIVDPVFDKVQGKDRSDPQVAAAMRLMHFVAIAVEAARGGLIEAQAAEGITSFSGIRDVRNLASLFPQGDSRYDRLAQLLLTARIDPRGSPVAIMEAFWLTIRGDKDTVDGEILYKIFDSRQLTEYGAIYMDRDVYPDAPTAPYTTPPRMV